MTTYSAVVTTDIYCRPGCGGTALSKRSCPSTGRWCCESVARVLGPAEAEDAWSETFLSAMKAYPNLRADSNFEAWLVTVAHRKAIDQWRGRTRRPIPVSDLPESASPEGVPGSWDSDLWDALKSLPPKQRQSVAYHYLAGLPYSEVAKVLGGSTDAARRAAADGIAALRRSYSAQTRQGAPR